MQRRRDMRRGCAAVVASAFLAATTALTAAGPIPAEAAAPQPVTAWYMFGTTTAAVSSAAQSDGCAFADNEPDNYNIMMLDFGAARDVGGGWGTLDFSGTLLSNADILDA